MRFEGTAHVGGSVTLEYTEEHHEATRHIAKSQQLRRAVEMGVRCAADGYGISCGVTVPLRLRCALAFWKALEESKRGFTSIGEAEAITDQVLEGFEADDYD